MCLMCFVELHRKRQVPHADLVPRWCPGAVLKPCSDNSSWRGEGAAMPIVLALSIPVPGDGALELNLIKTSDKGLT